MTYCNPYILRIILSLAILGTALALWLYDSVEWAFFFLFGIYCIDFIFCIGDAFDHYDNEFGDWP